MAAAEMVEVVAEQEGKMAAEAALEVGSKG
jgi:hypothetical protein